MAVEILYAEKIEKLMERRDGDPKIKKLVLVALVFARFRISDLNIHHFTELGYEIISGAAIE